MYQAAGVEVALLNKQPWTGISTRRLRLGMVTVQMRLLTCSLVVLAVLATGCGLRQPTSVEVDPALAALVPSDTVSLTGVKLGALRVTPLYQKWIAPELARISKQNGVDLQKDVSELLAISNGKDTAIFAKGKSAVFRLDSKEPLPRVKAGIPAALLAKMRSIPPQNQIWAASIGASDGLARAFPDRGNLANLRNVVAGLESWTVGMDLRNGLKVEANCVYRTEADTKRVHDGLRGLVALGRMSAPKDSPELLRFYDGIEISQRKSALKVAADVPTDSVSRLLDKFRPPQL
jgi:hypothetical protein